MLIPGLFPLFLSSSPPPSVAPTAMVEEDLTAWGAVVAPRAREETVEAETVAPTGEQVGHPKEGQGPLEDRTAATG